MMFRERVSRKRLPDARFGETPAALIHSRGDLTEAGVITYCNTRLADFKVPRYVVFVTEPLPRMASGKIAKRDLREMYRNVPNDYARVR